MNGSHGVSPPGTTPGGAPSHARRVRSRRAAFRAAHRLVIAVLAGGLWIAPVFAAGDPARKLDDATDAYRELLATPDRTVPRTLLENCRCVAVIPGVWKGALGWGARYGQGVASCRDSANRWSPPAFFTLAGGSLGFQIGAERSDVVLFFMTTKSAHSLLDSKFTLGAKVGLAAGPLGRTGEAITDLKLDAEIYSYAKSKGLFAGISLEGARLAPDDRTATKFYGSAVSAPALLFDRLAPRVPPPAREFVGALSASTGADTSLSR